MIGRVMLGVFWTYMCVVFPLILGYAWMSL